MDARAFYPGAPWYHLPSHWSSRLQCLFGVFGGLLGWLIAQQRSQGKLRRQLEQLSRTVLAEEKPEPEFPTTFMPPDILQS